MSNKNINLKKKPSEWKKGQTLNGSKIKEIYCFNNEAHYIVIREKNNITFSSKQRGQIDQLKYHFILNEILNLKFFKKDLEKGIAKIIELALLGKLNEAESNLKNLEKVLISRKKSLKKISYLTVPLVSTIMLSIIYITLISFDIFTEFNEKNKFYLFLLKLLIFGGIGNFLSISRRINKIDFDTDDVSSQYITFSIFKYLYSVFSVFVSYYLLSANIINFSLGDNETFSYYLIAILAGFSEKFIPNIFEKIEKKQGN